MKSFSNILKDNNNKIDAITSKFIEDVKLENLEDGVGIESFEFIDNIFYKVDKAFENSIKSIIDFFNTSNIFLDSVIEYKTKTPSITTLYKKRVDFIKLTNTTKFYKLVNKKVPVMLGLKITYKDLYNILDKNKSYINGIEDAMNRFNMYIDDILNSDKNKFKFSIDKSEIKALDKNVNFINKDLDGVTSSKILKDRLPLTSVVKDFNDMKKVIDDTLVLGNVYKMEKLEEIYELNETIGNSLNVLYKAIKSKNVNMTKQDIKQLSEYIGSMAKSITSIAFLFYLYYQLVDMLVATIKVIELSNDDKGVIDNIASSIKNGYNILMSTFK